MGLQCERDALSHVEIADHASLRLTSWTIHLVVCFNTLPAVGETYTLIAKGGIDATTTAPYEISLYNNAGTYRWQLRFVDTGGNSRVAYGGNGIPEVGQWITVMAWYTVASARLQLLVATRASQFEAGEASLAIVVSGLFTPGVTTPAAGTRAVRIGAGLSSADVVQDGADIRVSEVAIYNAQVAVATVESRMYTRLTGAEADLVAYYRADEQTGTTLYDISGNGRDGTLRNRPLWADDPHDLLYPTGLVTGPFIAHSSALMRPGITITASQENASYPASNLRRWLSATPWRTTDATGAKTLTVDFGAPRPVWLVSIHNHNLSSAADITVSLHTADSWGSPAYTSAIPWALGSIYFMLAIPQMYRYMRISITDAAAAGGYIQVGALHAWVVHEVHSWPLVGGTLRAVFDRSAVVEVEQGYPVTRSVGTSTGASVSFSDMRSRHAHELVRILRMVGGGGPAVWCEEAARALPRSTYGVLTDLGQCAISTPDASGMSVGPIQIQADRS